LNATRKRKIFLGISEPICSLVDRPLKSRRNRLFDAPWPTGQPYWMCWSHPRLHHLTPNQDWLGCQTFRLWVLGTVLRKIGGVRCEAINDVIDTNRKRRLQYVPLRNSHLHSFKSIGLKAISYLHCHEHDG